MTSFPLFLATCTALLALVFFVSATHGDDKDDVPVAKPVTTVKAVPVAEPVSAAEEKEDAKNDPQGGSEPVRDSLSPLSRVGKGIGNRCGRPCRWLGDAIGGWFNGFLWR